MATNTNVVASSSMNASAEAFVPELKKQQLNGYASEFTPGMPPVGLAAPQSYNATATNNAEVPVVVDNMVAQQPVQQQQQQRPSSFASKIKATIKTKNQHHNDDNNMGGGDNSNSNNNYQTHPRI